MSISTLMKVDGIIIPLSQFLEARMYFVREKKNASALRNRMRIRGKKAGDRKAGCLSREKKVWKCIFFMRGENFITHTREDAFTLNWRSNKKWEGSEICLISPKWPREAFQTNAQRLGVSYIYWSAFRIPCNLARQECLTLVFYFEQLEMEFGESKISVCR